MPPKKKTETEVRTTTWTVTETVTRHVSDTGAAKRITTTKAAATPKKRKAGDEDALSAVKKPKAAPTKKQTATTTPKATTPKKATATTTTTTPTTAAARPRQTARRSNPPGPSLTPLRAPAPKKTPAPKKEPAIKKETKVKKEEENAERYMIATDADFLDRHTGIYRIDCPAIAEEWPDFVDPEGQRLRLLYVPSEDMCWGSYDLGMFTGYFRAGSPELRDDDEGAYLRLTWRDRDSSEGQTSFGPQCTGWIRIRAGGQLKGVFNNMYGEVAFEGSKMMVPRASVGGVADFREPFLEINHDAYEEANRRRWGNYRGW